MSIIIIIMILFKGNIKNTHYYNILSTYIWHIPHGIIKYRYIILNVHSTSNKHTFIK